MASKKLIQDKIVELISLTTEHDAQDPRPEMISQMIDTCLKMAKEGHDSGQIKLVTYALKEMRYAYQVFNRYIGTRKVSIYGSARTAEDNPDYKAAAEFGRLMAEVNWMAITGAGDGIMKAGHEGPQREASFGLAIRLPFETTANAIIEGDPKLINFRYFFTRKLMFMTHSDAVVGCPGGFGTQDELFEALTLVQTGKSNIIPVVMIAGEGSDYWVNWEKHIHQDLLGNGMISEEDESLFHVATTPQDAVNHIMDFYKVYHSSRYVRSDYVIRTNAELTNDSIVRLNDSFSDIIRTGKIQKSAPLSTERDHLELPRIIVPHTRRSFGRLRQLIDMVNTCETI
ncbi:MAG: TIGR00730 family Rossman fold protein [Phycisphaerales bacterium]|nr:TIGR00730 family Rossman fold protein [Planctomycetota bacterium]MBL6998077.1 TIGR00730 family Rossman fold protein [Phycisphaerales bacterium]